MLGIITFCVVLMTVFETIKFISGIIELRRSREAFEEFVKSHPIPRPDDKDELHFK